MLHIGLSRQIGVGLNEWSPVVWDVIFREDCVDGAFWLAGAAVDAFIRMDEHREHKGAFIRIGLVNALYRANIHTGSVLSVDAGFGDDVSQKSSLIDEMAGGIVSCECMLIASFEFGSSLFCFRHAILGLNALDNYPF